MKIKATLLFLLFFSFGCSDNKKCSPINYKKYINEEKGNLTITRVKEKVVSLKDDIETVKGFDSCSPHHCIYLFQRKRISKDSTLLDGFFKTFYANGNLRDVIVFKDGKRTGHYKSFWNNGKIRQKGYMHMERPSGPQKKFYKTGGLKKIDFAINESVAWFSVHFQKSGKIDTIIGKPIRIMGTSVVKNRQYKVGQWIGYDFIVPIINNIKVKVKINLFNQHEALYDTTITQFYSKFNTHIGIWAHKLSSKAKGANRLILKVVLQDRNTQEIIKKDTILKFFNVN